MANRPNFELIHDAWVQRIGFAHKTAESVTYARNNETYTIKAKEIIVAAGAINSPKLLMLSGVGPKETLSALKIPVVADIPEIGSNLYDHHYSVMEFWTINSVETAWQWTENATEAAIAQTQYTTDHGAGPLGRNKIRGPSPPRLGIRSSTPFTLSQHPEGLAPGDLRIRQYPVPPACTECQHPRCLCCGCTARNSRVYHDQLL